MNTQTYIINSILLGVRDRRLPEVGDTATQLCWDAQYPYSVVRVLSPFEVVVRADRSRDGRVIERAVGPEITITLRTNGRWIRHGQPLTTTPYIITAQHKNRRNNQ